MTWFKVDDRFPESDKVIELVLRPEGLAALGVWTLCGAWAAGRGNGGRITEAVVKRFRGTRKHVAALVAVGLWDASDDEWLFHDWADYNESAESAEAVKVAEREAGRRGNHERWHVKRKIKVPTCDFCIAPPILYSDSGGDRVPDTDPDSGGSPPGPVPDPDPEKQIDDGDSHVNLTQGDARDELDNDWKVLGIKNPGRVIHVIRRICNPDVPEPVCVDVARTLLSASLVLPRYPESYIEGCTEESVRAVYHAGDWPEAVT